MHPLGVWEIVPNGVSGKLTNWLVYGQKLGEGVCVGALTVRYDI